VGPERGHLSRKKGRAHSGDGTKNLGCPSRVQGSAGGGRVRGTKGGATTFCGDRIETASFRGQKRRSRSGVTWEWAIRSNNWGSGNGFLLVSI